MQDEHPAVNALYFLPYHSGLLDWGQGKLTAIYMPCGSPRFGGFFSKSEAPHRFRRGALFDTSSTKGYAGGAFTKVPGVAPPKISPPPLLRGGFELSKQSSTSKGSPHTPPTRAGPKAGGSLRLTLRPVLTEPNRDAGWVSVQTPTYNPCVKRSTPQRGFGLRSGNLDGRIPAGIGRLDKLVDLWLYVNEMSAPLPAELGDLSSLKTLMLANNSLSGQIPLKLNNLSLDRLWLKGNSFTGCVPHKLAQVPDNDLSGVNLPTCSATVEPGPTPGSTESLSDMVKRVRPGRGEGVVAGGRSAAGRRLNIRASSGSHTTTTSKRPWQASYPLAGVIPWSHGEPEGAGMAILEQWLGRFVARLR